MGRAAEFTLQQYIHAFFQCWQVLIFVQLDNTEFASYLGEGRWYRESLWPTQNRLVCLDQMQVFQ